MREIIERALKEQPASGVSHDDLLSIGAGVGLSRAALESAARDVTEARLTTTATKRVVSRRRRWLAAHAFVYLAVNALLFAINFLTTPGEWWVLFPVFLWGIGLVLHAGFGLSSRVSERHLSREKRRFAEGRRDGGRAPRGTPSRRARGRVRSIRSRTQASLIRRQRAISGGRAISEARALVLLAVR